MTEVVAYGYRWNYILQLSEASCWRQGTAAVRLMRNQQACQLVYQASMPSTTSSSNSNSI